MEKRPLWPQTTVRRPTGAWNQGPTSALGVVKVIGSGAALGSKLPFAAVTTMVRFGPVVLFYRRSHFGHKQCTDSYLELAAAEFVDIGRVHAI
jgi:hypothetical protein